MFSITGRTEERPHSGRPRVHAGTPTCAIATKLSQLLLLTPMVHITTVYLPEGGPCARRPYGGCVLARSHRIHQRWLRQQWNSVLFSDESRFTIHRGDGRVRVYHRRNERYADYFILGRDHYGHGVFSWSGRALNMAFVLISSLSKVI